MTALQYGLSHLKRRPLTALLLWSVPELLPAMLIGIAVARAVDDGFLAQKPVTGLIWLGVVMAASLAGAVGARQVLRCLGDLVEPVRDDLVKRVVTSALEHGAAGRPADGAVTRLTRQVEIVRDTFAGLIVVARSFAVALIGTVAGMLSLSPLLLLLILPPAALGFAAFLATLKLAASRLRESVYAEERLAVSVGTVLAGARDVAATGAGAEALAYAEADIDQQAAAERAQAAVGALRTICYAVAAWVPLILVLAAGPWLADRGLTAGEIMGALTYLLFGFQPALGRLMSGLGSSGLKFLVTLGRILDRTQPVPQPVRSQGKGGGLKLTAVTFAYGPHSQPVLNGLDLVIEPGEHLAVAGPSGAGKSTLAAILCGLLLPDNGSVEVNAECALIPQEAYVFSGTVAENVCYLYQGATFLELREAMKAVGAQELLDRLGGLAGQVVPAELSAGERQQLALARAYLSQAAIVVLDEATCHLDAAAERAAEEAFMNQGRTLIVIAHRASSALRASRVLVLDGDQAVVLDPAGFLSYPDRFDAGAAAQLGQDPGEMIADGAVAQEQFRRDVPSR